MKLKSFFETISQSTRTFTFNVFSREIQYSPPKNCIVPEIQNNFAILF